MRDLCRNPNNVSYPNYGARGIAVSLVWGRFEAFRDWALATGYGQGLSIERINVDGPYSPANCT